MSCSPLEIAIVVLVGGSLSAVFTVVAFGLLHASSKRGGSKAPEMVRFMCSCCGELKVSAPTEYNQQRKPLCMGCAEYLLASQRPNHSQRHRR